MYGAGCRVEKGESRFERRRRPLPSVEGRGFGFGCRVSGLGFRVSGFGFRVSGFGSRVSGFGFRVLGLRFRAHMVVSWLGVSAPICRLEA